MSVPLLGCGRGSGTGTGGSGAATATWNPSDKSSANLALSGGDLISTCNASSNMGVRATLGHATGKYYYESTIGATYGGGNTGVGIALSTATLSSVGSSAVDACLTFQGGATYVNGSSIGNTTGIQSSGNVIGIAVDLDNKKIWLRRDSGNWNGNVGDNPATNTGGVDITAIVSGTLLPCQSYNSSGSSATANFGGSAYANAAPSGFGNW